MVALEILSTPEPVHDTDDKKINYADNCHEQARVAQGIVLYALAEDCRCNAADDQQKSHECFVGCSHPGRHDLLKSFLRSLELERKRKPQSKFNVLTIKIAEIGPAFKYIMGIDIKFGLC